MIERFGPIAVAVAPIACDGKLFFVPRRWSVFGIPLPRIVLPAGETFESEVDGRFNFDVAIRLPFLGDIVSYRGYLA